MSLEERKIQLEIKKLEGEIGWFKRIVESISALSSLITAIIATGTLIYAIQSDLIQNLVKKLKNDNTALQTKVNKLNNEFNTLSKQKIVIDSEIQKSKLEFIILKEKYRKEKIKLSNDIAIQKMQLKSVNKKLEFTEDCYAEAERFIVRFCVYYIQHNDHDYHPNLLVFNKTIEEIAGLNFSNMDYVEFLLKYANFQKVLMGSQFYLISDKTGKANIGPYKRTDRTESLYYIHQFNCWKGLTKEQRVKLLKKVTVHKS